MQYVGPDGRIIERAVDPLDRLDPQIIDGALFVPLTHSANWIRYRTDEGEERLFWHARPADAPDTCVVRGVTCTRVPKEAGAPFVRSSKVYEVTRTVDGVPVSRSLPRRNPATGKVASRYGHTIVEHSDGAVTNLQGQPVIDGKAASEREESRTGFRRVNEPAESEDT